MTPAEQFLYGILHKLASDGPSPEELRRRADLVAEQLEKAASLPADEVASHGRMIKDSGIKDVLEFPMTTGNWVTNLISLPTQIAQATLPVVGATVGLGALAGAGVGAGAAALTSDMGDKPDVDEVLAVERAASYRQLRQHLEQLRKARNEQRRI